MSTLMFQLAGTTGLIFITCMLLAIVVNISIGENSIGETIDRGLEIVGLSSLALCVVCAAVGVMCWIW